MAHRETQAHSTTDIGKTTPADRADEAAGAGQEVAAAIENAIEQARDAESANELADQANEKRVKAAADAIQQILTTLGVKLIAEGEITSFGKPQRIELPVRVAVNRKAQA